MSSSKRGRLEDGLLVDFSKLGVRRDGRASADRKAVHARERAGERHHDEEDCSLTREELDRIAFEGAVIELRATSTQFIVPGCEEVGARPLFTLAEHVTAVYRAPQGKASFTVRELCSVLHDFTPEYNDEFVFEGGLESQTQYGHFDILDSLTLVTGTDHTYEVKWICDPTFDQRAWDAAADKKAREDRAAEEQAKPSLRGAGVIGKDSGCAASCGFFAAAGSIYCSTCARQQSTPAAASRASFLPGGEVIVLE